MSFDLNESLERARKRFAAQEIECRRRQRFELTASIPRFSAARGKEPPARAALYLLLDCLSGHFYAMPSLPPDVRATLHSVEPTAAVPGSQVAFHCFNYGNERAISFAAGLPWLDLHLARRKRGWRAKSRRVLHAVCRARGI